ncbi:MAG: T9SS type A sorting domain-containing protein [Bacteroidales bacterium]|nr:T9SS type A sorting domain-containing protein [Bacteroidales bacterium]
MKHFTLFVIALAAGMSLQAQNYVNVRFTSQMQGGTYQVLDSVKVMNLTRGWEEMLYYPDTSLQMTNSTGIEETQSQGNALMQNIPNPFKASTEVSIRLQAPENISLVLYDMSGKQCAAYSAFLAAGEHGFTLRVGAAQAYVLSLQTSEGTQSITVLASESGNAFQISYTNYIAQTDEKPIQKAHTDNEFQTGDNMKFIGYTTYDSTKRTHQLSVSEGGADADYTFQFAIGYAVGDVYYDESGTAEGIVCWIADTVFSDSGKYYGLYGKMISLDQSGKQQDGYYGLMYARSDGPTYAFDSVDGRINTALHMALRSDTSHYMFKERIQAAKWCTDKGEGWYLPAKCEMYDVFQHIDLFNEVLTEIGGELFYTEFYCEEHNIYWTSTEIERPNDVGKRAIAYYLVEGKIYSQHSPHYNRHHVRAMKWFNEPEN